MTHWLVSSDKENIVRRGCGRRYYVIDNQSPEFINRIVEEKHRAKLAKNGEDLH